MKEKLSNKKLSTILNTIEKEFPVNTLLYRGINVWPYIRINLVYFFWSDTGMHSEILNVIIQKKTLANKIKEKYTALKAVYHTYLIYKRVKKKASNNNLILKKSGLLFISEANERKEIIKNRKIHPFANSISNYFENSDNYHIAEYGHDYSNEQYDKIADLNYIIAKGKLLNSFFSFFSFKKEHILNYDSFISFLHNKKIKFYFKEEDLVANLDNLFSLTKVLTRYLKKLKTKVVFFTVYFKEVNYSLSLACKRIGIKSVEIQHGQQGDYNPQNNNWANVPSEGYEMLPSHYWVWGAESLNRKKDLCTSDYHKAFVGGHPWLSAWLRNKFSLNYENKDEKIKVLIALQPEKYPIPNFLIQAMIESTNTIWLIRLHPYMKDRESEIVNILKKVNKNKYEIKTTTSLPLYAILKKVDYLITLWSSVAYEAIYFNVHSIIAHKNGLEIMSNYINSKIFSYADDTQSILKIINTKRKKENIDFKFIETDEKNIQKKINNLIK